MSRDSGATDETLELIAPGVKHRVVSVRHWTEWKSGEEKSGSEGGDWVSVGVHRGFTAMLESFLNEVRAVVAGGVWEDQEMVLAAILRTHELAEEIVQKVEEKVAIETKEG